MKLNLFGWIKFGHQCANILRGERQRGESLIDCLNRIVSEAKQWRELGASKPEPAPQNQDGPAIWPLVIHDLEIRGFTKEAKAARERHEFGIKKYGVPLVAVNGRDHLRDAYQEQLDKVVYIRAHYEQQKQFGDVRVVDEARVLYQRVFLELVDFGNSLESQ